MPGDDLLVGPDKIHQTTDALRRWLEQAPTAARPPGSPLAVTYRTGKSKQRPGKDCRFDSIWVSDDFVVEAIDHDFGPALRLDPCHASGRSRIAWVGTAPNDSWVS